MTHPNRNTLWARAFVEELVAAGVDSVAVAPGSRSTPLTVASYEHEYESENREDENKDGGLVDSHLDERSAAFFALGRGRATGRPAAVLCTSGTAAANFHPAVVEASEARVPLILLTADRPPELVDSGANQTVDQEKLYGDAVRWYHDMPEPEADARKVRMVRTTAVRAVAEATGTPAGPVHLNFRFEKPLEPVTVPGDVPDDWGDRKSRLAAAGRDGPFVRTTPGRPLPDERALDRIARTLGDADRGLVVAGPADPTAGEGTADALRGLARATGFPLLADPLSGVRFGGDPGDPLVCGGYDAYLDDRVTEDWPDPEVVVRVGASPTSKPLRRYLRDAATRQFLVDPAGGWREAEFTATDLVVADPERFARALTDLVDGAANPNSDFVERFRRAEAEHRDLLADAREGVPFEGVVAAAVLEHAPDPSTVFVSNSMPVRDVDRFGLPRSGAVTVLGNRGASGIDGITSTALGAGAATDGPLTLLTGDLAYYHDGNGLLAVERCDVDVTVVLVNNDGGGIFHMLPIEEFEPPFTEGFVTPHGLDFEPTAEQYGLSHDRVDPSSFPETYRETVRAPGSAVLEVVFDAGDSHRTRERVHERLLDRLS
jgi:2-succinyl-5-enolpyruvyl-6-hydroxy-3-cyclohexene-1-carboxylate synthase